MQVGPSRELFELWAPDARNGLIITGYSIEGTPAKVSLSAVLSQCNLHFIRMGFVFFRLKFRPNHNEPTLMSVYVYLGYYDRARRVHYPERNNNTPTDICG